MEQKTLYLHHNAPTHVSLEGPALLVRAQDQADRLLPLRRLERIQSDRHVSWEIDALLACAERNIIIQFTDKEGRTLARLLGQHRDDHHLVKHLCNLMEERPDWHNSYQNWRHGRRLQTERYIAQRLGYRFHNANDLEGLPLWCRQQLSHKHNQDNQADKALQWLRNDFYGYITHYLEQEGISRDLLLQHEPLDLARDLAHILGSLMLYVRHKGLQSHPAGTNLDRRLAAQWFHDQRPWLRRQLERMLNLLYFWTQEQYTWP